MIFKFKFRKKPTNDELLADLRRIAKKLNKRCISIREYHAHGIARISLFRRRFGTWNKALAAAGLQRSKNERLPDDELLENLREVWVKLGKQPRGIDMRGSRASEQVYRARFGSWDNALIELQKYLRSPRRRKKVKEGLRNHKERIVNEKFKRVQARKKLSYQLRYRILERDNYSCRACGRSPANERGVKLHIDHIIPVSKGGENNEGNLQTLCEKCNWGKGTR